MDRYDIAVSLGLVLLAAGLAVVYWPLALIVPGTLLIAIGLLGARYDQSPKL